MPCILLCVLNQKRVANQSRRRAKSSRENGCPELGGEKGTWLSNNYPAKGTHPEGTVGMLPLQVPQEARSAYVASSCFLPGYGINFLSLSLFVNRREKLEHCCSDTDVIAFSVAVSGFHRCHTVERRWRTVVHSNKVIDTRA